MSVLSSRKLHLLGIYIFFQILFLINIQFPRNFNFDEYHFVPQAQELFPSEKANPTLEHPPLGLYWIRLSIQADQNRPFGWRWISTVFGALSLLWVYGIGWALFHSHRSALLASLITGFNGVHFVASRVAMLEIFVLFFLLGALFWFLLTYDPDVAPRDVRTAWRISGVFWGLAFATKWTALLLWVGLWGFLFMFFLFRRWKITWPEISRESFYTPRLFRRLPISDAFISFLFIPLLVYIVAWTPMFFTHWTFSDWVQFHFNQFKNLQLPNLHAYASPWWEWPLMIRPTWFAFDREGGSGEFFRGVLFIGNPLVMWGGLLSLLACAITWVRARSRTPFIILWLFLAAYLGWAWVPRHPGFYYYYFLATPFLSFAIVFLLERFSNIRWIYPLIFALVFVGFCFFYPILAALRVPMEMRPLWLWFGSWI